MILTNITKEIRYKSFDRFSRFILIGNNLGGFVNVSLVEFENFKKVKDKLPAIIKSQDKKGEWDVSLYQISNDLIIKNLDDYYYMVPKKGKLILELTYMNACKNIDITITDAIIHVFSTTGVIISDYGGNEATRGQIFEEYITILLYEDANSRKTITNESYSIENNYYFFGK